LPTSVRKLENQGMSRSKATSFLLVDGNYLCHRSRYSTGAVENIHGKRVGTAMGVLRTLEQAMKSFSPDATVIAFDAGVVCRQQIYSGYKSNRNKIPLNKAACDEIEDFYEQIVLLRKTILPEMGYRNIIRLEGFEADDVIAVAVRDHVREQDRAVILSGDGDLWQCIRPNVIWKKPGGNVVSYKSFYEKWGIYPEDWPKIKAIAGDRSDGVGGVRGIGPKLSVKWVLGNLGVTSKAYQAIESATTVIERNYQLVRLPFSTTPTFDVERIECIVDFNPVLEKLLGVPQQKSHRRRRLDEFDIQ
jgi:5'-3' exonuclease